MISSQRRTQTWRNLAYKVPGVYIPRVLLSPYTSLLASRYDSKCTGSYTITDSTNY